MSRIITSRNHLEHTPLTCFWKLPSLRYRNRRPATVCLAEDREWPRMGIGQLLPQFNVKGLRNCKDVEFLLREQSRPWSFTTREAAGSRKIRAPAGPNSAAADAAQRASSLDGSLGRADRYADRGLLGLRQKDVDFFSGQIRIEQACYRGLLGSPKTKGSRRTLPLPRALVPSLIRIYEHASRTGEDDQIAVKWVNQGLRHCWSRILRGHLLVAQSHHGI